MRKLGIPTVLDRLLQQAVLQVLQPHLDRTFHPSSFGFRPGRSAHQAVRQMRRYANEGRKWVVDADLEKFFDRVNHDILMDRVGKQIGDRRVVNLIRRYLKAGLMRGGVSVERTEGTPQGGPLSPLLANLLLNEVDWELERRGLVFCRYADDLNVYVHSKRAAHRVMESVKQLMAKLHLKVNLEKSAVAPIHQRSFLGFSLWVRKKGEYRVRLSAKAKARFKEKVRTLTKRNSGRSMEQIVERLDTYLVGWRGYFRPL